MMKVNIKRIAQRKRYQFTTSHNVKRRKGMCMGRPDWLTGRVALPTYMQMRRKHSDERFYGWRFKLLRDEYADRSRFRRRKIKDRSIGHK